MENTMKLGTRYEVTVKTIHPNKGAIVELEDGSTQFIHISNVSDDYVKDVRDYLKEGDVLVAVCVEGYEEGTRFLSLKNLKLQKRETNHRPRPNAHHVYGGLVDPSMGYRPRRYYTPSSEYSSSAQTRDGSEKNRNYNNNPNKRRY